MEEISSSPLPLRITVLGLQFVLVLRSFHFPGHFVGEVLYDGEFYYCDGMKYEKLQSAGVNVDALNKPGMALYLYVGQ